MLELEKEKSNLKQCNKTINGCGTALGNLVHRLEINSYCSMAQSCDFLIMFYSGEDP
jgi:hypothetical protein